MRCVIIEDNYYSRFTIKAALEKMGHIVVGEAEDIKHAKDLIKSNEGNIDIVFLDLLLPDGNGTELIDSIGNKAKVVVITAIDQDEVDDELKKKGVVSIIKKPFSYDDLERVLKGL